MKNHNKETLLMMLITSIPLLLFGVCGFIVLLVLFIEKIF